MNKHAATSLKTDPQLKELAVETANPEMPNLKTAHQLELSNKQIIAGDYYKFCDNQKSLDFLADSLR